MGEPISAIWRRRAATVPAMLAATAAAAVALPLVVPVAALADLARGRWRLPTVRVYLFVLQYLINDSAEIVLAPILWLAAGFGTRLASPTSVARHERLMWWSAELLARRADQLLGLRLDIDPEVTACLASEDRAPVVIIARHVSPFDASLPGLVAHRAGLRVRGVIMAELLADPGFDILYRRLGSVFVPRDDPSKAIAEIERMARRADAATALLIFPEGRLFTKAGRDRALARLAEREPARGRKLAGLTNVLPPRPAGFSTLLGAVPAADVVVLDHTGLDGLRTVTDLVRRVPVDRAVRVTAERVPRTDLPTDETDLAAWLDTTWLELDKRLTARP